MDTFRFVHAADLHIDSPFSGLRDVNERVGERLRSATYEAFRNLVRTCAEEEASFLVIAGDVYDGEDRGIRAQVRFRDGLAQLAERGVQSFVVHGNHDPLDGWQSKMSWPGGVHVFDRTDLKPEWKVVSGPDGRPIAAVQGVSYPSKEVMENLAARFTPPPDPSLFSVGLLHCNVGGNPEHANYAPCRMEDLLPAGLDYWALGHVHTRQMLRRSRPMVMYPGNTQGRHPNESGPRGCLVVEVGPDRVPRAVFRPLDVVRWETVRVDIAQTPTLDSLVGAVRSAVLDASKKAEGRDAVCRVTLAGRGALHGDLRRAGAMDELLSTVRADEAAAAPWVWVERISNETRPEMDLDARARQDDFLGAVLRHGAAAALDPAAMTRYIDLVAEIFSGRRGGLDAPSPEELAEMTEQARWYLAELLDPQT